MELPKLEFPRIRNHNHGPIVSTTALPKANKDITNAPSKGWFVNAATGQTEFGIGVGTVVLMLNVVLLSSYTLGCHAMRHLLGGFFDEVSKHPACDKAYACSTALNYKHQLFAWCSLFSVGFSDLYVRLVSMGVWTDWRII